VIKRIDHPCTEALLKFREAKQQLSFFIDGWKPYLVNGRLHPSFKLHGTVTGRLSCENPNLQQVPRDPRIRTLISAPEGWSLIEADLSQIELRIAAELANERAMLEAFKTGVDVHWLTALREIARGGALKSLVVKTAQALSKGTKLSYSQSINILLKMGPDAAQGISAEWKEYRKKAKAINFGYLYGMWWKKFKLYARDNYGVAVTDEEAQASRIAFFDLYSDFPEWHKRQRRYVRKHGYVKSLSGRKRRLPAARMSEDTPERREAERQAINSPVQSFANEINLMAALQLRKEFPRRVLRIVGTVHDAVLLEVRNDWVERVYKRTLEIMSRPELFDVFDIELDVPIEAEAKIGPWAAGKSLKKWLEDNDNGKNKEAA
jgi:DNA polymerase-1